MQRHHYILTAGFSLHFILKISGSIEDGENRFISKGQYSRTLRPTRGSIPTDVFLLCFSCVWGSRPFYPNKQLQNIPTKTHSTLYREADFKARLSATRNLAPFLSKWFILYSASLFNLHEPKTPNGIGKELNFTQAFSLSPGEKGPFRVGITFRKWINKTKQNEKTWKEIQDGQKHSSPHFYSTMPTYQ